MAKRALLTGLNRMQCTEDYFLKQELKIASSHYSMIRCLRDMGWEVEQREVQIGEDLSGYDEVVLYLHAPSSYAHCLYSGLYAAYAYPNFIAVIDDWQHDQIMKSLRKFNGELTANETGTSDPYRDYYFSLYKQAKPDVVRPYHDRLLEGLTNILSRRNRFVVPAYAGGDLSLLDNGWSADRTYAYNPNPYHLHRRPENGFGESSFMDYSIDPSDKKREWIVSTLVHTRTRQDLDKRTAELRWRLAYYGGRRGRFKCERVTEAEMCDRYMRSWGSVMPRYYSAGCGWWRPRIMQVADAGSITLCDDVDGRVYSPAHTGLVSGEIEAYGVDELIALAKRQKEALYDAHPIDKAVTRREIQAILEASR